MKVKYLEVKEIEAEANYLIKSFEQKNGKITTFSMPVEEIVENHLGIHLEVVDFNNPELFGYFDITGNRIVISSRLDKPNQEGCFNFTLGHETGHYALHKEQAIAYYAQTSIIEDKVEILCRESEKNTSIEWQANKFSSYLIMPTAMVLAAWHDLRGSYKKLHLSELLCGKPKIIGQKQLMQHAENYIRPIAKLMKVSPQALYIRLDELGMITESNQMELV